MFGVTAALALIAGGLGCAQKTADPGGTTQGAQPGGTADAKPKLTREQLVSMVKKVGENRLEIERPVLSELLDQVERDFRSLATSGDQGTSGSEAGRLFGVREDSLLGMLGFLNGDRWKSIGGVENPQAVLAALPTYRAANQLKVEVVRRGQPLLIEFAVK